MAGETHISRSRVFAAVGVALFVILLVWALSPSREQGSRYSGDLGGREGSKPHRQSGPPLEDEDSPKGEGAADPQGQEEDQQSPQPPPSPSVSSPGLVPDELASLHGSEHRNLLETVFSHSIPGAVVDAGVNQAGATYVAACNGRKVYSFEALPFNVKVLRERAAKFHLEDRITVVHGALWDRPGLKTYFNNQESTDFNGQMTGAPSDDSSSSVVEVDTTTIDSVVAEDLAIFKMDVEGCELRTLVGARNLLTKHKVPFIILEYSPANVHATSQADSNGILYYLHALGYDVYLHYLHYCDKKETLRWSCLPPEGGRIINEVLRSSRGEDSEYLKDRLVRPSEFEEFTKFMTETQGHGAQADLLFARVRDFP